MTDDFMMDEEDEEDEIAWSNRHMKRHMAQLAYYKGLDLNYQTETYIKVFPKETLPRNKRMTGE